VASAVARMNKVLTQLRRSSDETRSQSVALADILADAVASKQAFKLRPQLDLPPAGLRVRAERERLTRAIGHLLQNALEATPPTGQVSVRGYESSGQAIIEIADTGSGMDEEFIRTRLFQPFDSTKGAGMGIGAYECRETIRALGGQLDVESIPGSGTRFRIRLPLDNNDNAGGDAA
jgi:putative PEP-CTERM system histidine kinase